MTVVFRPTDVPAHSRREYWDFAMRSYLGPVDWGGGPDGRDLPEWMHRGQLGALNVAVISAKTPGGAERRRRHIRSDMAEFCVIDLILAGHGIVEQDERRTLIRRGDVTLVDMARPARWRLSGGLTIAAFVFPRQLLPARAKDVRKLTAVRVPGDRGVGALVSSVGRELVDNLDECESSRDVRLGTSVLDLMATAFSERFGTALDRDTQKRARVRQINAFIDRHLADPALSVEMIAAAHHISTRYLHKLFQGEEMTVSASLRHRRLERCRRDLLDPTLSTQPVSSIAARWGLTDPAHFSRTFRAAYGVAPTGYRESYRRTVQRMNDDYETTRARAARVR